MRSTSLVLGHRPVGLTVITSRQKQEEVPEPPKPKLSQRIFAWFKKFF